MNPNEETNKQTAREAVGSLVGCELKKSFNGSTDNMVKSAMTWMGCEEEIARRWLQGLLSASGAAAVLQAYTDLLAKQAQGESVVRPIRYWSTTAANLKANPPKANSKPADPIKAGGLRGALNRKLAATEGAAQ